MHRYACMILVLCLALPASLRADICDDYRLAIDAYVTATDTRAAIDEALEAARDGSRAARASRSAIKALTEEPTRKIVEAAGAADALEAADGAGTALGAALGTVYERVKEAAAELANANATALEETRVEADEAAEAALDSLSKLKAVARRTALKAASATDRASPGATTSRALIAAHENIFRAACE